jgi:radical SAM superfamily enzyme YgiQ (UPF0313 family)
MKVSLISVDWGINHGIRSLSSFLKQGGHTTQLIFSRIEAGRDKKTLFSIKTLEELYELIRESDVVGISSMGFNRARAFRISDYLKEQKFNKLVIGGGIYATVNPDECIQHFDVICIGEGEEAMLELVNKIRDGDDISKIQNLWIKRDGEIIKNDVRPFCDLEKLPDEDYDVENHYILRQDGIYPFSERDLFMIGGPNIINVRSIRGCPHRCTYCCNYRIQKLYKGKGRIIRSRTIHQLIDNVYYLKENFPKSSIKVRVCIDDDDFLIRPLEEIKEFNRLWKERIALPFWCFGSPSTVDEEKLSLLVDAGLETKGRITFCMGIQSGSDNTNFNIYGRNIRREKTLSATKIINKYGIEPQYDILIANPYEDESDLLETLDLIQRIPTPFYSTPHQLTFFHGSELGERAEREGYSTYAEYSDRVAHYSYIKQNVFLQEILYWIGGKHTRIRAGAIPRFMIPFLLKRETIDRCNTETKYRNHIIRIFKIYRLLFIILDLPTTLSSFIKYDTPRTAFEVIKARVGVALGEVL